MEMMRREDLGNNKPAKDRPCKEEQWWDKEQRERRDEGALLLKGDKRFS